MYAKHIENKNITLEYLKSIFESRGVTHHNYLNEKVEVNIFIHDVVSTFNTCKEHKAIIDDLRRNHNQTSASTLSLQQQAEAKKQKLEIHQKEESYKTLLTKLQNLLSSLPTKLRDDVPNENIVVRQQGEFVSKIKQYEYSGLQCHTVFGTKLVVMNEELCRIKRALINWCMARLREIGFKEYEVPSLVLKPLLYQAGHLPHSENDVFHTDNYVMSPTGEVGLMAMLSNRDYSSEVRVCTVNQCYRAEAGAHGIDNKGLYRMHEFTKCEMVIISLPENRQSVLEELAKIGYDMIAALGLPVRTIKLGRHEVGNHSSVTYDTESIVNGKATEVGSASDCGNGQTLGLNITINGKSAYSFNGTAIACSRVLAALIEYYYDNGRIIVPEVLKPYLC